MAVESPVPRPAGGRKRSSVAELRTSEDAVEALESDTVRLRGRGRELLGIGGASPSLDKRDVVRASGWSNLLRLCALAAVDGARITALVVVSAQVSASLGIANLSVVGSYEMYTSVIAALGVGAWVARGMGQGRLATYAGFLSGLMLLGTAVATNIWLLLLLGIAGGAAGGVVIAVHRPLIMESFPSGSAGPGDVNPHGRTRSWFGGHRGLGGRPRGVRVVLAYLDAGSRCRQFVRRRLVPCIDGSRSRSI